MVIVYTLNDLNTIKKNKEYHEYIKCYDKSEMDDFINNYNFLKKNNENFKCILNKITNNNYEIIKKDILLLINKYKDDDQKIKELFTNIKEISIIQYTYLDNYINLITSIKNIVNIDKYINFIVQEYFSLINNINMEDYNNYEDLCKLNKIKDYLIGFTLFIIKLELNNIINNYIYIIIDKLFDKLYADKVGDNSILIYCIYEIFTILIKKKQLIRYRIKLNEIREMQTIKKNIFKIDDILELISL